MWKFKNFSFKGLSVFSVSFTCLLFLNLNSAFAFRPTIGFWKKPDICTIGSPSPGTVCSGGAIFLGTLSPGATSGSGTDRYMITPSGCGEIPVGQQGGGSGGMENNIWPNADFTPSCAGSDSLRKIWNKGSFCTYNVPALPDYSSAGNTGTGKGATNTDANYGSSNTTTLSNITAAGECAYYAAARYCQMLSLNGYTDWYLPNRFELNLVYTNRASIPGLSTTYSYWSSTECGLNTSWLQSMIDGNQTNAPKDTGAAYVRCVRRF